MAVIRIDLEVDPTGASRVLSATGQQIKDLGEQGKKSGDILTGVFQGIGQAAFHALEDIPHLLAEAGHAVVDLVAHLAEYAHTIEIASAKTGLSVETIQRLSVAARLTGTDLGAMTGLVGKLEKAIGSNNEMFHQLGMNLDDLKKKSPDEALKAVIERLNAIKNPFDQAAAGAKIFGKAWQDMAAIIKDPDALTAADRLGVVMSKDDVEGAAALAEAGKELSVAWEAVQNQFALAIASDPALVAILRSLVGAMIDLAKWVKENRGAISLLIESGFKVATPAVNLLWAAVKKLGEAYMWFAEVVAPGFRKALQQANDAALTAQAVALAREALAPKTHGGSGGGGLGETDAEIAKRVAAEDKAMREYVASYKAMEAEITAMEIRTHRLGAEEDKKFWDEQKHGADDYGKWYLNYLNKRNADQSAILKAWTAELKAERDEELQGIADMGAALSQLGALAGGTFGSIASGIGSLLTGTAQFAKSMGDAKNGWQQLGLIIQKVADIYNQGFASKSPGKGAAGGAVTGAAAGFSVAAVPGAIIGGLIGGIAGFIGGKKGQSAELAALRTEFDQLMAQAKAAGIVFQHTFDTSNAKAMKAAIDEIKGALDTNAEAQQKLNDAIQRYGFTAAELGPVLEKQDLDKQMAQIYQDWQLLTAAGVDHEAMLARVGPEVGKLVDQYIKGGIEIPQAMKGVIDDLYQHGKLLHEDGTAYTEAEHNGLHYAESMSDMFKDLITKVGELVDALNGIKPKKVPVEIEVHDPNNILGGGNGEEGGGKGPRPRIPGQAAGLFLPSASSDGLLRYHRGERIEITPAANSAARNMSGNGASVQVGDIHVYGATSDNPEDFGRRVAAAVRDNLGGSRTQMRQLVSQQNGVAGRT